MGPSTFHRFRAVAPCVAIGVALTTLVTCLIITKVKNVYVSGLVWPFFSDMGRDPPAYHVFCIGLTLLAVLLSFTWYFNWQYQSMALHGHQESMAENRLKRLLLIARAIAACGVISSIGLPVLAFFDTSSHTLIHILGAYWFFAWEVLAMAMNTYISKQLTRLAEAVVNTGDGGYMNLESAEPQKKPADLQGKAMTTLQKRRRTLRVQCIFAVVFFIGFLVYIPLGRALGGRMLRLTIEECLERNLGVEYCTVTKRRDDKLTVLFNAEDNFATVQLRACGQLTCILTLMAYSLSFLWHEFKDKPSQDDASEQWSNKA